MQLDLPLARSTDPLTSHQAAASANDLRARHVALIYCALVDAKPSGLTIYELAHLTRLTPTQVARRSQDGSQLWRIGPETRMGATGRQCRVWFAL